MSDKAGIWPEDGERIAKTLARAGICSRRDAERLIEDGRVSVNGKVLDSAAFKVTAADKIKVDGQPVGAAERSRMWRYHKPPGLVTTHRDPQDRPTVFERLPEGLPRVISIGRLDLNTEGLLLLTNDGAVARALELPSTGWVRRYRARAFGRVTQAELDQLRDGITIDGERFGPIAAKLERDSSANVWIAISLAEGKNREVRRVLEALGLKVNRLIRLSYGPFQLGNLEPGQAEEIGPRVLRDQLGALVRLAPEKPASNQASKAAQKPGRAARKPRTAKMGGPGQPGLPKPPEDGGKQAAQKGGKAPPRSGPRPGPKSPGRPNAKPGARTARRVR